MGIPLIGKSANEVIFREHKKNRAITNYAMWTVYAALGGAAGYYAGRIHKFAPVAIAGTLSLVEVGDSWGLPPEQGGWKSKEHVLYYYMRELGFALPAARAFALTAGISALVKHTGAFNISAASTLGFKAAPALVGLATVLYTYRGFTSHGHSRLTNLGYTFDIWRQPKPQVKQRHN